jgi:Domain of unknown function (DUF6484)
MGDRRVTDVLLDPAEQLRDLELEQLLAAPIATPPSGNAPIRIDGVRIGTLVGFGEGGAIPLVTFSGQPTPAAQPARATLDLHAAHLGRSAVLMFEEGDPSRPIIVGCLQKVGENDLPDRPDHTEVEADGKRLVVSAADQIVLRCGKSSITLTKEGKVIIQGAYVSSHSAGVLRLKGGSVHIN